jgi:hypothetical protein
MRAVRHRLLGFLVTSLAIGCVDVDFASTTGTTGSTGTGGDTGQGGGTTTSSANGGGTTTGTGGGPCVPTDEICNGADDDCDGITDEPPGALTGMFCGCTWDSYAGKLYALCPAPSGSATGCPAGTSKAILEDGAELTFASSFLTSVTTTTYAHAFLSLAQSPTSWDRVGGWAWQGGEGMALTWGPGVPDDFGTGEPTHIENHDEDCGALLIADNQSVVVDDIPCGSWPSGEPYVLCEQTGATCTTGSACLLAEGCTGTFDCTKPEGQRCVAQPKGETCNGLDDDCDGVVDGMGNLLDACGCTTHMASSGLVYKRCTQAQTFTNVHCGTGFRLAMPDIASEAAFVQSLIVGSQTYYFGAYQSVPASTESSDWTWVDRTTIPLFYWGTNQPNDGGLPENDKQNCMRTATDGWHDNECTQTLQYICEAVP